MSFTRLAERGIFPPLLPETEQEQVEPMVLLNLTTLIWVNNLGEEEVAQCPTIYI